VSQFSGYVLFRDSHEETRSCSWWACSPGPIIIKVHEHLLCVLEINEARNTSCLRRRSFFVNATSSPVLGLFDQARCLTLQETQRGSRVAREAGHLLDWRRATESVQLLGIRDEWMLWETRISLVSNPRAWDSLWDHLRGLSRWGQSTHVVMTMRLHAKLFRRIFSQRELQAPQSIQKGCLWLSIQRIRDRGDLFWSWLRSSLNEELRAVESSWILHVLSWKGVSSYGELVRFCLRASVSSRVVKQGSIRGFWREKLSRLGLQTLSNGASSESRSWADFIFGLLSISRRGVSSISSAEVLEEG